MIPLFTLLSPSPFIDFPQGWAEWAGFILLLGVLLYLLWKWRSYNQPFDSRRTLLLAGLLILVPITSLFIGFRLPIIDAVPPPGIPMEPVEPLVMVFSSVPWVLAAGLLGPLSAALLALLSGLLTGIWHTHDLFLAFEMALMAVLFSAAVRQNYRTRFYRLLRHPLGSAILLSLLFPLLHLLVLIVTTQGLFVSRLDYALQSLTSASLVFGIEFVIGGVFGEIILLTSSRPWVDRDHLVPSPSERSLETRLSVSMAPLAITLILTLMIGDWLVAGQAAREMMRGQMADAAQMAAQGVPTYLQIGQQQITQLAADPGLKGDNSIDLTALLGQDIKEVPFFDQLSIIGKNGEVIASYPANYTFEPQPTLKELVGIQVAMEGGMPIQYFSVPPAESQNTAQISFIASIFEEDGSVRRVLTGRSDLGKNPFSMPVVSALQSPTGRDDVGMLVDEEGNILVHPNPDMLMTTYTGRISDGPTFYENSTPDGTRMMVYSQPAAGSPWSIVMMVPVYRAQELALQIAIPLLAMIAILSLFALIILRIFLRMVTGSLNTLAQEAGRIAQGKLDQPLPVDGADEVGQLRRAFEQMRLSLKGRLEELNRLLVVSQGVASSLEITEAVQPVLEAALAAGASSARVVLASNLVSDLDGTPTMPMSFGTGPSQNLYRDLDEQILVLTRQQERLVLSNLYRPRLLNLAPGAPHPESLMAVALRHENLYYGTLWIAYDQPHNFSEEEVRFIVTLGGQAALAAANARLFQTAEIGRQRLESILASNPDPVLVTDQRDRLLLANPAAWQVMGLNAEETNRGKPVNQVLKDPELVNLLRASNTEKQSIEITLPGGRIFMATATPILAEGQRVGRVCVLRDVTHFKELDDLKSEFVSTVSHDLRSPLTLMRGYATMLEMVGQLNEQQNNYVRKIVTGVESMGRLVNNLLDLGRIESGVGLQVEPVNVLEVSERVISSLQLQAAQKHIQLTCEFPENPAPPVEADQALLQQALHNLVENAIKYTRTEGKVHLRVRVQPIGVLFEVIDNGIGISPVDQPRLFEKFYRGAQQGSKEQRGTGLGLAIVKSIAEKHGGRVWAESQLGKGSTFYLAIPVHQSVRAIEI